MKFSFYIQAKNLFILGLSIGMLFACKMHFKTTTESFKASASSGSFENGKNLAFNICGQCHYDKTLNRFAGKPLNDLPKIAGRLYSANLTRSASDGIPPHYTDAELFYLLKTGISKSGRFMPYMMRPMMADQDINDIIIYLRSDDEAVAPVDKTLGKTHINVLGNVGIRALSKPQPINKGVARPDENNAVDYGRYLVSVIGCYHCHSQKAKKLNYLDAEKTKGYLLGGMKFKDSAGRKVYAPNLTPDKETGIGNLSQKDFNTALSKGILPSGRELNEVMPRFVRLNEKQLNAIYSYLQSLPPVHHRVKNM
jgi:mono/diheme cytochrome c family protein